MKNNLLKLLALTLVMGLFVGCSDDDDTSGGEVIPPVEPATCVYTPMSSTILVDANYTVECSADLDGEAQDCIATGTVDSATVGIYNLAYAAATCPNPDMNVTVTVKEEDEPVTPPSDVTAENILPN